MLKFLVALCRLISAGLLLVGGWFAAQAPIPSSADFLVMAAGFLVLANMVQSEVKVEPDNTAPPSLPGPG